MPINPLDSFRIGYPLVKNKLKVLPLSNESNFLAVYFDYLCLCGFLKQDNPLTPTTLVVETDSIAQLCYRPHVTIINAREILASLGFTQDLSSCNGVKFVLTRYSGIKSIEIYKRQILGSWSMY